MHIQSTVLDDLQCTIKIGLHFLVPELPAKALLIWSIRNLSFVRCASYHLHVCLTLAHTQKTKLTLRTKRSQIRKKGKHFAEDHHMTLDNFIQIGYRRRCFQIYCCFSFSSCCKYFCKEFLRCCCY